MLMQHTLKSNVVFDGVGLHGGQPVRIQLQSAPVNTGIVFRRVDVRPHVEIAAHIDYVVDTTLSTTLGKAGVRIATVEHVLSACRGVGLDNVLVIVDGPEMPIADGSALPFVEAMMQVGLQPQSAPRHFIKIKQTVTTEAQDKRAVLSPGNRLQIGCEIVFAHPLIGHQSMDYTFSLQDYASEIAPARTFGFAGQIEALRARGLAKGGSLANALVFDEHRLLNPEGLRYPSECVRHKILDIIGDLALLGAPVLGHCVMHCPGHWLSSQLAKAVLADARHYEWTTMPMSSAA